MTDVSLNDNANVRKRLNENIYTPGVLRLERQGGGIPMDMFWGSGFERIAREGCRLAQVGVGYGWVTHRRITHHPQGLPRLHALRLHASM
jgi:hypothetical protein